MRFAVFCAISTLLCSSTIAAQNWQKVYPPQAQTGRWAAVTKVPGGAWYIAGDGLILRTTDFQDFIPVLSGNIDWRGISTQRLSEVAYAVVATGGSSMAISDGQGGSNTSTLPHSITSAGGIACSPNIIDGPCVVAAGDRILFGLPGAFAVRSANISNHNANHSNDRLFVTGYGGGVSAWDGVNWIDSVASFADVYDVVYGPDGDSGNHYVTFGDAGAVGVSIGLSKWTTNQPLGLFYAKSIIFAEGRYLAVGEYLNGPTTSVAESTDGSNWTAGTILPGAGRLWDIQYFDGTYIAVGDNREIWVQRQDALFANDFE